MQSGETVRVALPVQAPINADTGSKQLDYDLHLDLWDPAADKWYTDPTGDNYRYYAETSLTGDQRTDRDELLAAGACALTPTSLECPDRVVEAPTSTGLGLEKFGSYGGEETGAGSQALVNLANGNLVWTYDAFTTPSVGPSFFTRVAYNSGDDGATTQNPSGGFGWSVQPGTLNRLNTPLTVVGSGDKSVTLTDGDGTQHVWKSRSGTTTNGVTTFRRPAGVQLDLTHTAATQNTSEVYEFARPDGTRFLFEDTPAGGNATLLHTATIDLSGNKLSYAYDSASRLVAVTDQVGRTVGNLSYHDDGRIKAVCDSADPARVRALVFGYHASNDRLLSSFTDGQLTAGSTCANPTVTTAPDERKTFGFGYDDLQLNDANNLKQVTDPRGAQTRFGYYAGNDGGTDLDQVSYPTNSTKSVPSWVLGKVRTWIDRRGRESQVEYYQPTDTIPSNVRGGFPIGASVLARTLDLGASYAYRTEYGIDGYGRTIQVKDPFTNGPNSPHPDAATKLGWDADHNVVRMEEPNAGVSRWRYDRATGYPIRIWDAEATEQGYDPTRLTYCLVVEFDEGCDNTHPAGTRGVTFLKSITTPRGNTSTFEPDAKGRLAKVTDPENGITEYVYHANGTLLSSEDARDNKTTYAYPAGVANLGYPSRVTPPVTLKAPGDTAPDAPTELTYDKHGNVLTSAQVHRDATGAVVKQLVTTATYDVFNRPLQVTTPGAQGPDRTTGYAYDSNDNLTTLTAPNDAVTSSAYTADDQVVSQILPSNGAKNPDGSAAQRRISYGYDGLGRLCRQIAPQGTHPGSLTQPATCPATESATPPAYATDTWYDAVDGTFGSGIGQQVITTRRDPSADDADPSDVDERVVSSGSYDAAGDLVKVIDPNANRGSATDVTAEYVYDLNHRPVRVIDALGHATRTAYDAEGQVTRTVDQAGNPTTMTYDAAGRPASVTVTYDPPGREPEKWTTRYGYDKAGNRTHVWRARADETGDPYYSRSFYDENNRPVVSQTAYDPNPVAAYGKPSTTYVTYDRFGRTDAQSVPASTTPITPKSTVPEPSTSGVAAAPAGTEWTRVHPLRLRGGRHQHRSHRDHHPLHLHRDRPAGLPHPDRGTTGRHRLDTVPDHELVLLPRRVAGGTLGHRIGAAGRGHRQHRRHRPPDHHLGPEAVATSLTRIF